MRHPLLIALPKSGLRKSVSRLKVPPKGEWKALGGSDRDKWVAHRE
jgi:hypothetical protein